MQQRYKVHRYTQSRRVAELHTETMCFSKVMLSCHVTMACHMAYVN